MARTRLRQAKKTYCQNHPLSSLLFHCDPSEYVHRLHCDRAPTVILTQREPGSSGRRGRIALCNECLTLIKVSILGDQFSVEALSAETQVRAEVRLARKRRNLTGREERAEARGVSIRPVIGPDLRLTRSQPRVTPVPPKPPRVDHFDHLLNERLEREADPFFEGDDDYAKLR